MKHYDYIPRGVCSTLISFDLDDEGLIHNLTFRNGCNGNLKAIGKLVDGKSASEISSILKGNTCGFKSTSCADQLSQALVKALNENKN